MELDITADMTVLCRVCMIADAEHLTSLHDTSACGGQSASLHEMLQAVCAPVFTKSDVEVDILPDLPTKVCPPCRNAIVAAYNLHQQCIETDRRLGELLALKWELQGPGGEADFVEVENEIECSKPGEVSDIGDGEELKAEQALSEESNQNEPLNESVAEKCDEQKKTEDIEKVESARIEALESTEKLEDESLLLDELLSYSCSICGKKFDRKLKMQRHMISHREFQTCTNCDHTFKTRASLLVHVRRKVCHVGPDGLRCEYCATVFASKMAWKEHKREAACKPNAYPCTACGKVFDRPSRLRHHMNNHGESFDCPLCNEKFTTNKSLFAHYKSNQCPMVKNATQKQEMQEKLPEAAAAEPETFPCDICERTFSKPAQLRYHRACHKQRVVCQRCGQMFTTKGALRLHINRKRCPMLKDAPHDLLVKNEFQCKDCNMTFSSKRSFDSHIEEQKCQQTTKGYPCNICGKTFDRRSRLTYHRACHKNRVACPWCSQTFSTRDIMRLHIKRNRCPAMKNGSIQEDDKSCTENLSDDESELNDEILPATEGELTSETDPEAQLDCENGMMIKIEETVIADTSVSTDACDSHKQEKHVVVPELQSHQAAEQTPEQYRCDKCEQSFESAESLHTHKRSHRKRIMCKCGKTLPTQADLQRHLIYRCMGDKVRTCDLCNITFDTIVLYRKHRQENHDGPIDCPKCGRTFGKFSAYRTHVNYNRCKKIDGEKPSVE